MPSPGTEADTQLFCFLIAISQPQARSTAAFDQHLEAETAWAVGFTAYALSEEEEELLPPGADDVAYVLVGGS